MTRSANPASTIRLRYEENSGPDDGPVDNGDIDIEGWERNAASPGARRDERPARMHDVDPQPTDDGRARPREAMGCQASFASPALPGVHPGRAQAHMDADGQIEFFGQCPQRLHPGVVGADAILLRAQFRDRGKLARGIRGSGFGQAMRAYRSSLASIAETHPRRICSARCAGPPHRLLSVSCRHHRRWRRSPRGGDFLTSWWHPPQRFLADRGQRYSRGRVGRPTTHRASAA